MCTVIFFPFTEKVCFWMFTRFQTRPVGLNFVARVRLLYPPPTTGRFPVIGHCFAITSTVSRLRSKRQGVAMKVVLPCQSMLPILASVLIIGVAIILHEVAHGYAAFLLGDPTAKDQGRLTLNPVSHIDLLGTIIIPAFLIITQSGFLFGWAKPVPYNPYNLRGRYGEAIVAAAGPLTNIGLAILFALVYRLFGDVASNEFFSMAVIINLFLAFLNLLPIPPLDGSKIISALLPMETRLRFEEKTASFTQNPLVLILILLGIVFFLSKPIVYVVLVITMLMLGA